MTAILAVDLRREWMGGHPELLPWGEAMLQVGLWYTCMARILLIAVGVLAGEGMSGGFLVVDSVLAASSAMDAPERPARLEPVVISAGRVEQALQDVPANVTVLTREDIEPSAAQTVDDLLRQIPGFSLFRRSSSLVANPTTQGVSRRGIGPSGVSRTLVLLDGVPLNDPFGGWVYWSKVPPRSQPTAPPARSVDNARTWDARAPEASKPSYITGRHRPGLSSRVTSITPSRS